MSDLSVSQADEPTAPDVSVLFICLGNICRSPMAEAVLRNMALAAGLDGRLAVDSAGTSDWHVGEPPHASTLAVLRAQGIAEGAMRGRQLTRADLSRFDYLVVMDAQNERDVRQLAARTPDAATRQGQIVRLLDYADPALTGGARDVPDPYFTGAYEDVYRWVASGCAGLLAEIAARLHAGDNTTTA